MNNALQIFAVGAALSLAASALPAHAAPAAQEQEHRDSDRRTSSDQMNNHADYSNNSYYQLGNREGYEDYNKKQQRKAHKHKFRNDEDRAAHDAGYQQGWSGQSYNNTGNTGNRHVNDDRNPR